MKKKPTVELKLPILKNMELVATQTAEVVSKHMQLSEEKSGEKFRWRLLKRVSMLLNIRNPKSEIYIHFLIDDDNLIIKVIDKWCKRI